MSRRTGAAALLAVAALAGCGGDAAESDGPTVTQHITRDFGRELVAASEGAPIDYRSTVLRLLSDGEAVETTSSGRAVLGIDGLRRREGKSSETTWALNVNGIESDTPPPEYWLHPGDVVQWDYRDWYVLFDVRATTGAFPETFTRGMFGARFPTTVECARPTSTACRHVERTLQRVGVTVDGSPPPGPRPPAGAIQRARVLVGPWKRWRRRTWPRRIDRGARYSGVFARFTMSAERIRLLDWDGRTVRTVGAGSGLIAAQRPTEEDLVWFVTGVDEEGVERAARALTSDDLRDAFALVVTRKGAEKVPLPLANPRGRRSRVTE